MARQTRTNNYLSPWDLADFHTPTAARHFKIIQTHISNPKRLKAAALSRAHAGPSPARLFFLSFAPSMHSLANILHALGADAECVCAGTSSATANPAPSTSLQVPLAKDKGNTSKSEMGQDDMTEDEGREEGGERAPSSAVSAATAQSRAAVAAGTSHFVRKWRASLSCHAACFKAYARTPAAISTSTSIHLLPQRHTSSPPLGLPSQVPQNSTHFLAQQHHFLLPPHLPRTSPAPGGAVGLKGGNVGSGKGRQEDSRGRQWGGGEGANLAALHFGGRRWGRQNNFWGRQSPFLTGASL
ncbi:hypothetical protein B0H14DRAFT_3442941 [Mycena olivaceomarginata]|nr:hypothetical protein B0H14DRAFT_3442941 [Mycena olivaceomarginata]